MDRLLVCAPFGIQTGPDVGGEFLEEEAGILLKKTKVI
jgi:hypothetical protein